MALVCSRPTYWFDSTGFFDHWKQIIWHQFIPSAHLCIVYACQHSIFQIRLEKEVWNLFFVFGIFLGGIVAFNLLANPNPVEINPQLATELATYGITDYNNLVPQDIMNWESLFTLRGFLMMVVGGFLVGFGTRYAGGCTSGHAIMGLSNLQLPSLIATISFMVGGFIMANLILPIILLL